MTDGFLIAMAAVALICMIVSVVSFKEEYVAVDPVTYEEITVDSGFKAPAFRTNAKMLVVFALAAIIGFAARKHPAVDVCAMLSLTVLAFRTYADGRLSSVIAFIYVLFAVIGLAGGLIHAYYFMEENKQKKEAKDGVDDSAEVSE